MLLAMLAFQGISPIDFYRYSRFYIFVQLYNDVYHYYTAILNNYRSLLILWDFYLPAVFLFISKNVFDNLLSFFFLIYIQIDIIYKHKKTLQEQ